MSKRKSQKPSSDVDAHDNDDFVSKSQKKREMAERQKVGTDLVELSDAQLKSMPLDDELRDVVLLAPQRWRRGLAKLYRELPSGRSSKNSTTYALS